LCLLGTYLKRAYALAYYTKLIPFYIIIIIYILENIIMTVSIVRATIAQADATVTLTDPTLGEAQVKLNDINAELDGEQVAALRITNPRGYLDLQLTVDELPRSGVRVKIASLAMPDANGVRKEKNAVFIHESQLASFIAALVAIHDEGLNGAVA
jgi:hypothetical protein